MGPGGSSTRGTLHFVNGLKGQLISKWFFGVIDYLQKTNEQIRLYYYDTSGRRVFVRFLEEIDDPKKPFRNQLTFRKLL